MKLQLLSILTTLIPLTVGYPGLAHFLEHGSLAGLSQEQVRAVAQTFSSTPGAQPLPSTLNNTSAKLVYDKAHPWKPLCPGDIRGVCPGLNTLASHGYINCNGVATLGEIITAVQEGFNMGWGLASFLTYTAFIVDGNHLTNLMSISANMTEKNQLSGGLNIHGNFEGDVSTTRGDFYFSDNYSFNETLFGQLTEAANLVGNGTIMIEAAALDKAIPRVMIAYAETTFPLMFFVSNQTANTMVSLTVDTMHSFFNAHEYPEGFYRRQGTYDFPEVSMMYGMVFSMIGVPPGHNKGVGNFVTSSLDTANTCYTYSVQANLTTKLYPNPTTELRMALKANLATFYQTLQDLACPQVFPFGQ